MEHPLTILRRRHGLTQESCATIIGAGRVAISKIEANDRRITLTEALRLVERLGFEPVEALVVLRQLAGLAEGSQADAA